MARSPWKETPPPSGPVPQHIIDEANRELDNLCAILFNLGVEVYRPDDRDFVESQGMYNYCPRDRLLVAGTTIVDPAMLYPCRDQEIECVQDIVDQAERVLHMPRDQGFILDAANVCRMNNNWLYLVSQSGNVPAMQWLRDQFPDINIEAVAFYGGVHIDSTVVPLDEGLVLFNGERVNEENLPQCLSDWDRIYINDMIPREFHEYPYASKWIGLNMLVVRPGLVVVDSIQTVLIELLRSKGIHTIPIPLTHSRTLGGGFHCTTLDLHREK
jgi:glycine amidinotransferase/scyllo-inosamine-4-phosphate amidinotransferase 1